ncbi:Uncharacterised protein [Raoultella ornithinolytica]|nr:Uncharacterised protein [Raoultella ornithinolytica]
MSNAEDVSTSLECCQKCRCYYHPSERKQHVCVSHEDEFDDHPADEMSQYQDHSYDK